MRRLQRGCALFAVLVAIAGCGTEPFPVAEVTGRVTLEGRPLEGIVVEFEPASSGAGKPLPTAFGITDADGRYRAFRTGNRKYGAAVGVNHIRVTSPEGGQADIHPHYAEPRAFVLEVVPGPNVFDLELVADPPPK